MKAPSGLIETPLHFELAVTGKTRKKRPSPISMRFPPEFEDQLKARAKGQSLGTYCRDYIMNGHGFETKTRGRNPIKDHVALARVLSALGQSGLYSTLTEIYRLASEGHALTSEDTVSELRSACEDVAAMRRDLVAALNVREGERS